MNALFLRALMVHDTDASRIKMVRYNGALGGV